MSKRVLEVEILGDASKLKRALGEADSATEKTGGRFKTVGLAAKVALAGGIGVAVEAGKKFIDAAKEEEVTSKSLQTQVNSSGQSYKAHADEIEDVVNKQEKLSALSKGDLMQAFTALDRATGSVTTSTKLMGLTTDLARAKNITAAKAAIIIGKVHAGNVGVLGKYGIAVKKGTSATEALGLLQSKVAGQAKAFGDSSEGAADRSKNSMHDLEVLIGDKLLPAYHAVVNAVYGFVQGLQDGTGAGGEFKGVLDAVVSVLGVVWGWIGKNKGILEILAAVVGTVVIGFEAYRAAVAISTAATAAFDAVLAANPIGLVVLALAALTAALVVAYTKSETFRAVVDGAWTAVKATTQALVAFIRPAIEQAFNFIKGVVDRVLPAIVQIFHGFKETIEGIVHLISGILHGDFSEAWEGVKQIFSGAVDVVIGYIRGLSAPFRQGISTAMNAVSGVISSGWHDVKAIVSSVGHGILTALEWPFQQAFKGIKAIVDDIKGVISTITSLPGKALGLIGIGHKAAGGMIPGNEGLTLVGEQGPELISAPGSRVYNARDTAAMTAGHGDINQHFYGPVGSTRAARVMAETLAYRMAFG